MSETVLAPEVDVYQKVYSKEELRDLRKRLAGRVFNIGGEYEPPSGESNQEPPDWKLDVELIIKFLRDLDTVMKYLVEKRISGAPKRLLQDAMEGLVPNLNEAVEHLRSIDSETHESYGFLRRVGLTLESLAAKLDGIRDDFKGRPVLAFLDSADKILGSLCKVLPMLEPVKEMKETIEHRVKYGGDAEFISLGLYRS
jgi:hypothetical protein